jgi:hypothetical protein
MMFAPSITTLCYQAECLSRYAFLAPFDIECNIIAAATHLRAAAAMLPAVNDRERLLQFELLGFFRALSVPEEWSDQINKLERELD